MENTGYDKVELSRIFASFMKCNKCFEIKVILDDFRGNKKQCNECRKLLNQIYYKKNKLTL